MNYKKEFDNLLMGKLYYKNGGNYEPANEIVYNHPLIQELIQADSKLREIENYGEDDSNVNQTFAFLCNFELIKHKDQYCQFQQEQALVQLEDYILKTKKEKKDLDYYKKHHEIAYENWQECEGLLLDINKKIDDIIFSVSCIDTNSSARDDALEELKELKEMTGVEDER